VGKRGGGGGVGRDRTWGGMGGWGSGVPDAGVMGGGVRWRGGREGDGGGAWGLGGGGCQTTKSNTPKINQIKK